MHPKNKVHASLRVNHRIAEWYLPKLTKIIIAMTDKKTPLSCNLDLYKLLTEKSAAKLEVYEKLKAVFLDFKSVLSEIHTELSVDVCGVNEAIEISFEDVSAFETKFQAAGDVLYCYMHSNVFALDEQHYVLQHSHLKKNPNDAFFGTLNMYYFMADSVRYNRLNDNGILLVRILVNRNGNFFVEGVKPFGEMERFDESRKLTHEVLKGITEKALRYMLEIDLTLSPKAHAQLMSVADIQNVRQEMRFKTKQTLGFMKR
jgi:hypothetical protein